MAVKLLPKLVAGCAKNGIQIQKLQALVQDYPQTLIQKVVQAQILLKGGNNVCKSLRNL